MKLQAVDQERMNGVFPPRDPARGYLTLPAWLREHPDVVSGESSIEYLARHSHSFRYAARFLPAPYDTLVADVYAFCRFTDDLVDVAQGAGAEVLEERLNVWSRLARDSHAGRPSGIALLDRPLMEMARRDIPFEYVEDLLRGVAMDLSPRRYVTLKELDVYSYRVASVVGLWLTRLVGVHATHVLERATDLGIAMQTTNILRDVGEDWARGRLYLPLATLRRHGIREEGIAAACSGGPLPAGWADAMEELMAAAELRYESAIKAVPMLPRFFQRPVMVSALVYRDIHTALRRNGYDNLRLRAHTSASRKVWLGLKARLLLAGSGWSASRDSIPVAEAA